MILSMTGFAAVTAESPDFSLVVELRSVNHRYLDLTIKLSDEVRGLEPDVREILGRELERGKVEGRVGLLRKTGVVAALVLDRARIVQLREAAAQVAQTAHDAAPLTVAEILRWPGVLTETESPPDQLAESVVTLIERGLSDLRAARAREGAKLAAILETSCAGIEAQILRVTPRIPQIYAAYCEKLGTRLQEAGVDTNDDRLKQEFALFASKIDVAEELARLATHVAEVRRVLRTGGSAGKRLDFLAQELHREANTLGSKSVDAEISQAALELKVAIEQMREQVQNIE